MTGFDLYMPQGMAVCDYVTGIGIWFNNRRKSQGNIRASRDSYSILYISLASHIVLILSPTYENYFPR